MTPLPHRLERELVIRARPATVFSFFTDSARWAAWWGTGSTIDARVGGRVLIRQAGGPDAAGEVVSLEPGQRVVFTYGRTEGPTSPPGSTRVTIELRPHPEGTVLSLRHEFADEAGRDEHVQGWRYQLSLFANLVANSAAESAAALVDRWNAAWSEPDQHTRDALLADTVSTDVRFADRFSAVQGLDDVRAHLAAVHKFMPGMRLARHGDVRHCQWHVLSEWVATDTAGAVRGAGTNLFVLDADGRIAAVTGFWSA